MLSFIKICVCLLIKSNYHSFANLVCRLGFRRLLSARILCLPLLSLDHFEVVRPVFRFIFLQELLAVVR